MAKDITPSFIRNILRNEFPSNLDKFEIIKAISLFAQRNTIGQELVLRLLSRKPDFSGFEEIIDSLVRQVGLYPYITQKSLSLNDS